MIELLVVLALLGFLSVLLFAGMHFGARSWDNTYAHASGTDDVRVAQELLRRSIGGAYPYFQSTNQNDPHVAFSGSQQQLTLLAPPPAARGIGGLARYSFKVMTNDGKISLALIIVPELLKDQSNAQSDVLLAGLKTLSFSYFGGSNAQVGGDWQGDWRDRRELPALVKIDATFFDDDERLWPELVVAPRIDMDVSCVFDFLTHYCRGRSR